MTGGISDFSAHVSACWEARCILLSVIGAVALTVPLQCWRQHLLPSSPCSYCNSSDVTVLHVFSEGFPSRPQGNIASCDHVTVDTIS